MVGGWVFVDNLRPFIEVIAGLSGYEFSESDWIAVEYGVRQTDVESNKWFDYGLPGARPIRLSVAADPGSSVVFVRVRAEQRLEIQVTGVIATMQSYNTCHR